MVLVQGEPGVLRGILKRIGERGAPVSLSELEKLLGSRNYARVAAHRLVAMGALFRLSRGLYATSPPSLAVAHPFARVTLEHCIVGAMQVDADAIVRITSTFICGSDLQL